MLDVLRAEPTTADWLKGLEAAETGDLAPLDIALPSATDLPDVLLDLAVPHQDINELLALRDRLVEDPGATWLLEQCVRALVRDLGRPGKAFAFPPLPEALGALGRCFTVLVFVAALPFVRAHHRERGVPDDIARRTLADLGRHLAVHRRRRGTCGLSEPDWIALHFRGELYQLGRLQFQRARISERRAAWSKDAGLGPGDLCLSVHIPDFRGPLSPAACDQSVRMAVEFFARHYPEENHRVAVCLSWLLDPQLRRLLPQESNVVRFQDRFRSGGEASGPLRVEREPEDTIPVGFVFGDPDLPIATLPRRTGLERAVGDHLRAGGHWYGGYGWFTL